MKESRKEISFEHEQNIPKLLTFVHFSHGTERESNFYRKEKSSVSSFGYISILLRDISMRMTFATLIKIQEKVLTERVMAGLEMDIGTLYADTQAQFSTLWG